VFCERTSVGLDVHARSVAGAAIDGETGEVFRARLTPSHEEVIDWVRGLPGPSAAVYEAGPTGFGLYRALSGAGIRCEVAASSKLQRPGGDRVKTDARDAMHLARLVRLDEVVSVRVPTETQEAARDLVRAREASRSDLMRARHRLSKLLLRHGIVYAGGKAWTAAHDAWLLRQHFDLAGTQAAFEDAYETVALAGGRRDRLDEKITVMAADCEFTSMVHRLACLRGISTLTAFALAVEVGDWDRFTGASIGAYLGLVPSEHSSGQSRSQGAITKDRQHPRPQASGRGSLASPQALPTRGDPASTMGPGLARSAGARARWQPASAHTLDELRRTQEAASDRERRRRPRAGRLVLVLGDPGGLTPIHPTS